MVRAANSRSSSFKRPRRFPTISMQSECPNDCTPRAASSRSNILATIAWMLTDPPAKTLLRKVRLNKERGSLKRKAAAWFQPHCGHPGKINKLVLKSRRCSYSRTPRSANGLRKTTGLRSSTYCRLNAKMARLAFQPQMLPAADPIAD